MGPLPEGSIRRPIAPWANALTTELHLAPGYYSSKIMVIITVIDDDDNKNDNDDSSSSNYN